MFRTNFTIACLVGIGCLSAPAFSQSETSGGNNEVSVQAFGSFVKSTSNNGIQNTATDSGGVLGTYRYFFSAHSGIEADYGYSLNTQSYSSVNGSVGVKSYSHEISGAYVFRMPLKKFTPFLLAGGGGLIFDPSNFAGASTQARGAFIYGAGADLTCRRVFSCGRNIEASCMIRRPTL